MTSRIWIVAAGLALMAAAPATMAQNNAMSFFVTSVGLGKGGDLGGVAGADRHCQTLAQAAGVGNRTWRAYVSTERADGRGESARMRIGNGPWYNAKGVLIANDVDDLHLSPNLRKSTALTEKGETVRGFGDQGNQHDMLTGTMADGTAYFPDDEDHTCNNWTSSDEGSAQLGHTDRMGGGNTSWNSAHASRGCSQDALISTGGAGMFYCFAAD